MRQRGVENIRYAATDIVGFKAGKKSVHVVPWLGASVTTIIEQVSWVSLYQAWEDFAKPVFATAQ
jgi:hypothetical protein